MTRKCHNHKLQTSQRKHEAATRYTDNHNTINPYKPSFLFVGHRPSVQNQIRRRKTRRLIWFSTVCLQKFFLKNLNKNEKFRTTTWLVKLMRRGKYIRHKWVKVKQPALSSSGKRLLSFKCHQEPRHKTRIQRRHPTHNGSNNKQWINNNRIKHANSVIMMPYRRREHAILLHYLLGISFK